MTPGCGWGQKDSPSLVQFIFYIFCLRFYKKSPGRGRDFTITHRGVARCRQWEQKEGESGQMEAKITEGHGTLGSDENYTCWFPICRGVFRLLRGWDVSRFIMFGGKTILCGNKLAFPKNIWGKCGFFFVAYSFLIYTVANPAKKKFPRKNPRKKHIGEPMQTNKN